MSERIDAPCDNCRESTSGMCPRHSVWFTPTVAAQMAATVWKDAGGYWHCTCGKTACSHIAQVLRMGPYRA